MNLLSLTLAVLLAAEPQHLAPGDHNRTLQVDGRSRTYLVHVPPKCDQPTPVVLSFHGGGSNAEQMVRFCGLNEKADKEGFIVVYPNGTGRQERMLTFNGGNCCAYAMWNNVDDVGFTRTVLDDLAKVVNVDAKRVFATGMSNGGIVSYRLASELSDRIAAIASVAGTMGTKTCNPKRPVSVMHFHGTDDKFLPFQGGIGPKSLAQVMFISVDRSIDAWVKADGCPAEPVVADMPKKADDGTSVQKKTYGPGKDGAEVVLFTIKGGGHTWPGRDTIPAPRQIDAQHFGQRPDVGVLQEASDGVSVGQEGGMTDALRDFSASGRARLYMWGSNATKWTGMPPRPAWRDRHRLSGRNMPQQPISHRAGTLTAHQQRIH